MAEHREPTAPSVDELTWALCPIFLACEDCDMPQIMNGPRPECRHCPGPDENGRQAGCRIPAEIAARIALGLLAPPTGRVEPGERSNTDPQPETTAAPPSPPAVVDYTERSRPLVREICPNAVRVDTYHASCDYPECRDESLCEFWKSGDKIAAALSAVASEHQAEIEALRHDIERHQAIASSEAEGHSEALAKLETAEARLEYREGHREPCYYCGKPVNSLAGNPGEWPVALCHADDPGKVKFHHTDCVYERLHAKAALLARLRGQDVIEALIACIGSDDARSATELAVDIRAVITEKLTCSE